MQTITQKTLADTMYYKNIPVFIYKINYPSFTTTCNILAAELINVFYLNFAKNTQNYCRKVLYPQAVRDKEYSQNNYYPFNSYTLDVVYKITYNAQCITSLYIDTYTYMGGAHGETKRTSDTWDFNTGKKLHLNDFYPLTSNSLHTLQVLLESQVTERLKINPGSYFDNYRTLLLNNFNIDSYYLQPNNGVIYYQQYDIAPYSTGLPEFYFPYTF